MGVTVMIKCCNLESSTKLTKNQEWSQEKSSVHFSAELITLNSGKGQEFLFHGAH